MIANKIQVMKDNVMSYISLIDQMLELTFAGAVEHNWEKTKYVVDTLEPEANAKKIEISQECLTLLALFHPEASNLRAILKMSGMARDLERMGDMVSKIAHITFVWKDQLDLNQHTMILEMAQEMRNMLSEMLQAFSDNDVLKAIKVIQQDDKIDEFRNHIIKTLIQEIKHTDKAENIEPTLQLMNIARHIERMADHCTHLAEDVIFIKEGLVSNKDKNK